MACEHVLQQRNDFAALHLASARARKFFVRELHDFHSLIECKLRGNRPEVFFDLRLYVLAIERRVELVIGNDKASDPLASFIGKTYNAEFLDQGMMAICFFQLIGIYVLAAGTND